MPFQKFGLYDIVVDIIPGIVVIALLSPVVITFEMIENTPSLELGIGIAFLLVSAGFVIGRVIHGVSSPIDSLVRWVVRKSHKCFAKNDGYKWFRNAINPIVGTHYNLEQHMGGSLWMLTPDTLKTAIAAGVFHGLEREFDFDESDLGGDYIYEDIEHLSYSILYDENVLYRKYEILTTFFRSMYFISLIAFIVYLYTYLSIRGKMSDSISDSTVLLDRFFINHQEDAVVAVMTLFLLFIVFLFQKRKFSNRRYRALFYDLFLYLEED